MEDIDKRRFVLGVDVGTSRIRCVAINKEGKMLSQAHLPVHVKHPVPDASEIDPEELWQSFQQVVKNTLEAGSLSASNANSLGITNQRGSFLLWERESSKPLCNIITWQDRRAAQDVLEWNKSLQLKVVHAACSLAYFFTHSKIFKAGSMMEYATAQLSPRLWWLLSQHPSYRPRAKKGELCFGTIDTWLIWKLTNGQVHATDCSNAGATLVYDPYQLDWLGFILNFFNIPKEMLPEVKDSGTLYGHCAEQLFGCRIPITGIISDQTSSTFAQMCWEPGDAKCTMGTGMFVCINTGRYPRAYDNGFYPVIGWKIGDDLTYLAEGMFSSIGSVVDWGKEISLYSNVSDIESMARSVESSGGVCFVPCFDGIAPPINDPTSTGSIIGLSHSTTQAHIVRAMLESFGFICKHLFDVGNNEVEYKINKVRVDGGVFSNGFVAQFTADLLQLPVQRPVELDQSVYGAVFVSGLASGFWQNRDEIKQFWKLDKEFQPGADKEKIRENTNTYRIWQKALERSLYWY